MNKVFFINGIFCDDRNFSFLNLSFCEPVFVEWIEPLPKETIGSYAKRLFTKIIDENATIVGLSFGGMVATEMALQHPKLKVILISSAKTATEIPAFLKVMRHVPLYHLLTQFVVTHSAEILIKLTGIKGQKQQQVQKSVMKVTNAAFTRWAIYAIVNWKNKTLPKGIIHMHGTDDKLLPIKNVKADFIIPGGEHLMVMDNVHEISQLLKKLIQP